MLVHMCLLPFGRMPPGDPQILNLPTYGGHCVLLTHLFFLLLCDPPLGGRITRDTRLSVCPFVCPVPIAYFLSPVELS